MCLTSKKAVEYLTNMNENRSSKRETEAQTFYENILN